MFQGNSAVEDYMKSIRQIWFKSNLDRFKIFFCNSFLKQLTLFFVFIDLMFVNKIPWHHDQLYCNEFNQLIARQELSKHGSTHNNRGSHVVSRPDQCTDKTGWIAIIWYVFTTGPCPIHIYKTRAVNCKFRSNWN
jgi:hypothetical protein